MNSRASNQESCVLSGSENCVFKIFIFIDLYSFSESKYIINDPFLHSFLFSTCSLIFFFFFTLKEKQLFCTYTSLFRILNRINISLFPSSTHVKNQTFHSFNENIPLRFQFYYENAMYSFFFFFFLNEYVEKHRSPQSHF